MDKRFITFLLLSFVVLSVNMMVMRWLQPPPPAVAEADKKQDAGEKLADKAVAPAAANEPSHAAVPGGEVAAPADAAAQPAAQPEKEIAEQRFTLGSADPQSGYRELVTFVNTGAAVERVELNSDRYLDQEDWSGYLGHLDVGLPENTAAGALVRVVGPGTPAAVAGLRVGDLITALNDEQILGPLEFQDALDATKPDEDFSLTVRRGEETVTLTGKLRRRPMQVIRPEALDPLSFLVTLQSVDDMRLAEGRGELPGISMRTSNWQALPQTSPDELAFQYDATKFGLQIIKRFRLGKVAEEDAQNVIAPAYHLEFAVEVRNVGTEPHSVSWRLDGPTGLPLEGAWYATKISPRWFRSVGMRDIAVGFLRNNQVKSGLVGTAAIAEDKDIVPWQDEPLAYLASDAQYFAVALLPDEGQASDYARALPIVVGDVPGDKSKLNRTNVSFRLESKPATVAPGGAAATLSYRIFAGPKMPSLLAKYNLGSLVYYGWFGWVAEPMLDVLHFFYRIIPNYGVAIVLLTVLVRSIMFPLSRRQAANAQKMQELQPEIKRIQEKYKGNMEARSKAQQDLFRKHNYNPLAGCLPVFLQLPIFLGLYRSLSVDVELRGAPLLSESIRWASNLAAPDMLWNWQAYLPAFLTGPTGFLGPYFNVFPLITIGLFIWQQKMFMPPAADEQAAMQQKVMQYMMVFMGLMFFKVPSGLCLYFISSSLWGIAERKLIPKLLPASKSTPAPAPARISVGGGGANGSGGSKKKNRGRA